MNNDRFSIIVPSRGDYPSLKKLLHSLRIIPTAASLEIIIVVNPESNLRNRELAQFKDLNILHLTSKKGVNFARNVGLLHATGDYILFLDDDCTVSNPELLDMHVWHHQQNPWTFAVGGYYRNPYPSEIHIAYNNIQNNWIKQNIFSSCGETTVLLGGHFSINKKKFNQFFDENIVYGGSETEFFFRLASIGYRFLQSDLLVDHHPKLSTSILAKKAYLQGKTHAELTKRNVFIPSRWQCIKFSASNRYEKLYHSIFNQQRIFASSEKKDLQKFRFIKSIHEKICFYLENRNLF